jgi:hypothetical protein
MTKIPTNANPFSFFIIWCCGIFSSPLHGFSDLMFPSRLQTTFSSISLGVLLLVILQIYSAVLSSRHITYMVLYLLLHLIIFPPMLSTLHLPYISVFFYPLLCSELCILKSSLTLFLLILFLSLAIRTSVLYFTAVLILISVKEFYAAARVPSQVRSMGLMVDKVALGQVFSEYFDFPYLSSFHRGTR